MASNWTWNRILNGASKAPRLAGTCFFSVTHLVPSILSLTVLYSHELSIRPQNRSTSLQPLGLCTCFSRSSSDWLTLSHHSGLNSNVTFSEMPATQPPSLYPHVLFLLQYHYLKIYLLSLFPTPTLELKFRTIRYLACLVQSCICSTWQRKVFVK